MRFADIREAIAKGHDIPVTPVTKFTNVGKGKRDKQLQNRVDRRKKGIRKPPRRNRVNVSVPEANQPWKVERLFDA